MYKMQKQCSFLRQLLLLTTLACSNLQANHTEQILITRGNADFTHVGEDLHIKAAKGTILEWQNFGNAENTSLSIDLPSRSDTIIIQDNSDSPSAIHGTIHCNGGICLFNAHGILIGGLASIEAADVSMNANTIVNKGKIQASHIELQTLEHSPSTIIQAGTLVAKKDDHSGGTIRIASETIFLTENSSIDASGYHHGGFIKIGGGWHGRDPSIINASHIFLEKSSQIKADALTKGGGGTVIVWSDDITIFLGHISARGTGTESLGGIVEISSKGHLIYEGCVDTSAESGHPGTLNK